MLLSPWCSLSVKRALENTWATLYILMTWLLLLFLRRSQGSVERLAQLWRTSVIRFFSQAVKHHWKLWFLQLFRLTPFTATGWDLLKFVSVCLFKCNLWHWGQDLNMLDDRFGFFLPSPSDPFICTEFDDDDDRNSHQNKIPTKSQIMCCLIAFCDGN